MNVIARRGYKNREMERESGRILRRRYEDLKGYESDYRFPWYRPWNGDLVKELFGFMVQGSRRGY